MTRPVLTPCEPWAGAIAGVPRYAGKSVRRLRMLAAGLPVDGPLTVACGRVDCVALDHIIHVTDATTHCRNGHELTPSNLRWRVRRDKGETRPTRECRTCWERSKHRRREQGGMHQVAGLVA